ncbi:unnamed protein product [Lymnaea stagnalis]|uniref:Uncharacterized protein n=1 Tax=Lymnaea stagnalis TaxID=6523 RepID=A0AAV2IMX9_LYMST
MDQDTHDVSMNHSNIYVQILALDIHECLSLWIPSILMFNLRIWIPMKCPWIPSLLIFKLRIWIRIQCPWIPPLLIGPIQIKDLDMHAVTMDSPITYRPYPN